MRNYLVSSTKKPLTGEVLVSGSKNASLPIMAASLLTDEEVVLNNVPRLSDTATMAALLNGLGKEVFWDSASKNRLVIRPSGFRGAMGRSTATGSAEECEASYALVKKMRASIVVLGPLLGKRKKAVVSLPGGCSFGPRPVDMHLKGMEALGADIKLEHGYIRAEVSVKNGLKGTEIDLMGRYGPTVLGTDNVAMAASLAEGTTTLRGAAMEPETTDLMAFLSKMGANIEGAGTATLRVHGVEKLSGAEHTIIDDRIEAGTFITYAALTQGEVLVRYGNPDHLKSFVDLMATIGVRIEAEDDGLRVFGSQNVEPFRVVTEAFPGFPTDLQSILMVLGCSASGTSTITETIYPNRFNHVPELVRMGANLSVDSGRATIVGSSNKKLEGASVQASDLRSGAALVGAALVAEGETTIRRVYHIERGYEDFVPKLRTLGAEVRVSKDEIV